MQPGLFMRERTGRGGLFLRELAQFGQLRTQVRGSRLDLRQHGFKQGAQVNGIANRPWPQQAKYGRAASQSLERGGQPDKRLLPLGEAGTELLALPGHQPQLGLPCRNARFGFLDAGGHCRRLAGGALSALGGLPRVILEPLGAVFRALALLDRFCQRAASLDRIVADPQSRILCQHSATRHYQGSDREEQRWTGQGGHGACS